jgi:hypothetical protein
VWQDFHTKGLSGQLERYEFREGRASLDFFNSLDQTKQHLSDFDNLVDQHNHLVFAECVGVAGGDEGDIRIRWLK